MGSLERTVIKVRLDIQIHDMNFDFIQFAISFFARGRYPISGQEVTPLDLAGRVPPPDLAGGGYCFLTWSGYPRPRLDCVRGR